MLSPWTQAEIEELIAWHESVIEQYPIDIVMELRDYRTKCLSGLTRKK